MADQKFRSLIIDSDTRRRMALKGAMGASGLFEDTHIAGNFREGLSILQTQLRGQMLIFVTDNGKGELRTFVSKLKEKEVIIQNSVLILVASGKQSKAEIATSLLSGVHGILVEPFSVEGLVEASQLAIVAKGSTSAKVNEVALGGISDSAIQFVDQMANQKSRGLPYRSAKANLQSLGKAISHLSEDELSVYCDTMTEKFDKARAPAVSPKLQAEQEANKEETSKSGDTGEKKKGTGFEIKGGKVVQT